MVVRMTDIYSGSCLCGQVHFEAAGKPKRIGLCHCKTCRKVSGSAFNFFAVYPREAVKIIGVVSERETPAEARRYRCRYCGAPVYEIDQDSSEIELPVGAFDRIDLFEPSYETWTTRRERWLPTFPSASTRFEKNRRD
jgi:hypothetical protein